MLEINFPIIALAALIPLFLGAIWYHKKVFGSVWIKVSGVSEEQTKSAHMWLVFVLTYVFSLFLCMALMPIVIHQFGIFSVLAGDPAFMQPGSETTNYFADFMTRYGTNFRTFKHGVFHGVLIGIFFALPIFAINAMFEKKGFKYIAINVGYWIVSLALMGGVICAYN
jgi:hypothetical protein